MNKPKFNYGDYVYHARLKPDTISVPCPDCGGKMYNTIILDGETFTIECRGCEHGWMGSTGRRDQYVYETTVLAGTISGVSKESWEPFAFEYHISSGPNSFWILKEEDVFLTEAEALSRADVLKAERDAEEAAKITKKTKPDNSWAWHVRYYQHQIKDAQETIDRATLQLDAARKHVKVEKESV